MLFSWHYVSQRVVLHWTGHNAEILVVFCCFTFSLHNPFCFYCFAVSQRRRWWQCLVDVPVAGRFLLFFFFIPFFLVLEDIAPSQLKIKITAEKKNIKKQRCCLSFNSQPLQQQLPPQSYQKEKWWKFESTRQKNKINSPVQTVLLVIHTNRFHTGGGGKHCTQTATIALAINPLPIIEKNRNPFT